MGSTKWMSGVAACLIGLAAAGIGSADIIETVTFQNVDSVDGLGNPQNDVRTATLSGGYTLVDVEWDGLVSPVIGSTWGSELNVRITRPDGASANIQLGSGNTFGANTQFTGTTGSLADIDTTGLWTFEFYDSFDDGNGADARWSEITFSFRDDGGGGGPGPGGDPTDGPDVSFCEFYDLAQHGRVGDTVGLAVATTSWNVGDENLDWNASPSSTHPFIAMNLYRLQNDRFEQVGQSWCKHGFASLNDSQCGSGCQGGAGLGPDCTDTYWSSLNASQSGLGPRFEINPWTGGWNYNGSMFQTGGPSNNGIRRRLQVQDADLTSGGDFFSEGYYVAHDDVNVMNSAAWKPVTPNGVAGGSWSFGMSGFNVFPNIGFAIDAWTGASQTVIAEVIDSMTGHPVDDDLPGASPDGRCILAYKVTDNGNGTWHYEYALLNIDMDRQVKSFSVPLPTGVNVSNVGFHAPRHHDEPVAYIGGPAIDNAPWSVSQSGGQIEWSTATNPLRWGTLYNFRFDADAAPTDGQATLGMFKPGTPTTLSGATSVPSVPTPTCPGDATGDNVVDINDLNAVIGNFGSSGPAGDLNNDNSVDVTDLNLVIGNFGTSC